MFAALLIAAAGGAVASANQGSANDPIAIKGDFLGLSDSVAALQGSRAATSTGVPRPRINPLAGSPNSGKRGTWNRKSVPSDPLTSGSRRAKSRTPAPGLVFDGTANPFACGGCSPPDTVGDVGPNHYVQAVNATKIAIYDKSGTLLTTPPFDLGTLFSSGQCTANAGDPQVTYDQMADRWVLSQFAAPNHLCFAVSQTADPLASYYTYEFDVGSFPDYFKVGAWPSGYYVSSNESSYTAYAFDRASMLAGNPATGIKAPGESNFMLPADVDGSNPPGPNEGGLFYTFKDSAFHGGANDRIELFRLNPDFGTPGNSTFGLIEGFPIAPFTYTVCGFFNFDCIPQSGTAQTVDSLSEWPMQRFPYREFNDHQALVGNFTVGGGSATPGAAIRWFELRNTGSGWTLFQEGTHDPGGGLNRFMGSIAIDSGGDIALGYSASSTTSFPSIRYVTRTPGDPPGTFGAEQVMQAGGGSQTGSNRWGDYSAMSVDPATECDFWYTNEYYSASSATSWKTAIGTFMDPSCGAPAPSAPTVSSTNPASPANDNNPKVIGSAAAGSAVKLYANSTCTGGMLGSGSSASFALPGITATVADNSTTTIYATATDAASKVSACSSSSATYTEDSIPPETTITSGPADGATVNTDAASFGFSSNEAGSTFQCGLDSAAYASCSSPKSYSGLADGAHSVQVRATDPAGNTDATPAGRAFTVDTKLNGSATAKKKQKQKRKKIVVRVKVKAKEDLDAKGTGKVKVKKKSYKLKPKTKSVAAGKKKTLKLKPKKKQAKKIAKALKPGKKAIAKLKVRLTDEARNKKIKKLKVKLKR